MCYVNKHVSPHTDNMQKNNLDLLVLLCAGWLVGCEIHNLTQSQISSVFLSQLCYVTNQPRYLSVSLPTAHLSSTVPDVTKSSS